MSDTTYIPDDDPLEELKKQKRYLTNWIGNFQNAQSAVPIVNDMRESIDWQIDTIEKAPPALKTGIVTHVKSSIARTSVYMTDTGLPMIPEINQTLVRNTSGFCATTDTSAMGYLSGASTEFGRAVSSFVDERFSIYNRLQEARSRVDEVRRLINTLGKDGVLQRFDRARQACNECIAGVGAATGAALEMRTLLDGVKGELMLLTRKKNESKVDWQTMCERLAGHDPDGSIKSALLAQEDTRKDLYGKLSSIAKDYVGSNYAPNIENLWSQVIEHLYAILTLSGARFGKNDHAANT